MEHHPPRLSFPWLAAGAATVTIVAVTAGAYYLFCKRQPQSTQQQTPSEDEEPQTLAALVTKLKASKHIQSERVAQTWFAVDRADFVVQGNPYRDAASPIGFNATISAPHIVWIALSPFG
jgi:hypothetical protein